MRALFLIIIATALLGCGKKVEPPFDLGTSASGPDRKVADLDFGQLYDSSEDLCSFHYTAFDLDAVASIDKASGVIEYEDFHDLVASYGYNDSTHRALKIPTSIDILTDRWADHPKTVTYTLVGQPNNSVATYKGTDGTARTINVSYFDITAAWSERKRFLGIDHTSR